MTDEQKITGLIPAKALGCLNSEDNLTVRSYIDEGFSFPWDELGKYQTVASLLPLALQLEIPEPQLKDNVALKLIKLSEELRTKKIQEEKELLALTENEEERNKIPEENETQENLVKDSQPDDINQLYPPFNIDEIGLPEADATEPFTIPVTSEQEQEFVNVPPEVQLENLTSDETDLSQEILTNEEDSIPELQEETQYENSEEDVLQPDQLDEDKIVTKQVDEVAQLAMASVPQIEEKIIKEKSLESFRDGDNFKKSLNEKIYRALEQDFDTLKFSVDESERKLTRNLLMAYVAIAILLALLIFSFFKFTSDIKSLENEVKDLKKNITSELMDNDNFTPDYFFHS